jgi:hypothetical protein
MADDEDQPSSDRRYSVEEYRAMLAEGSAGKGPLAKRRPKSKRPRRSVAQERNDTLSQRILRLMTGRELSARIRLKPEEILARAFANALRQATIQGRLRCVWTHPANEVAGQQTGLAQIRYAIAKAMGLIDGTADYLFLWADGSGALEAKVGDNGQQANQVDFEAWCVANGVRYATFTTVEEGLAILVEWGVLTPLKG